VAGIVASSADSVRPSTQASSAVVVGASAMAAHVGRPGVNAIERSSGETGNCRWRS
jgi:hypothetical protein